MITEQQLRVLLTFELLKRECDQAPTYKEVADYDGTWPNNIVEHVKELISNGYMRVPELLKGKSRALRITPQGNEAIIDAIEDYEMPTKKIIKKLERLAR